MTDRSVVVRLMAVTSQYNAAMASAGASTRALGKEVTTAATTSKDSLQKVGTTAAVSGGLLVAGFALAQKATIGFDKQLSALSAASQATAGEMESLRQAALDAGQATIFSASEAAEAETELAKAGLSAAQIMGGALAGALDLAAAGGIGVADAATYASQALKIFKLDASQTAHVADLLAAGAQKSLANVDQMAQSLAQGGLVAAQTGLTVEETAATLSLFADNALMGSDAGTSLKTMLLNLNPKSKEAAALMEQLGLSAYDASGEFIGMQAYAGKLQGALKGMSAEQRQSTLMTIFGTDAVRAASIVYGAGASGIAEYEGAVNDVGAAQRMAAEMTNNLSGDLEQLKGALETALIGTGSESTGVLREMTQGLTGVVQGYNALPGPVKGAAGAFAGLGGAALLVGGGLAMTIPRIVETRAAMRTLSTEMPRTSAALSRGAKVVGGLAAAFTALQITQEAFHASDSELLQFINEVAAAAGPDTQRQIDALKQSYVELRAEGEAGTAFGGLISWSNSATDAMDKADALEKQIKALESQQKVANLEAQSGAAAMRGWTTVTQEAGAAADGTADEVADLEQAMKDLNDATLTQRAAQRGYEQALDDANAALKDNGKSLDKHTQKGRDNAEALDAIATAAADELVALDASGASAEKVGKRHDKMREDLIKAGTRFGMTKKQAERYADAVLAIPKHVETTAEFHILADIAEIGRHSRDEHSLKRAAGGWIGGSGGPTQDNIPVMASHGEFVVNARAAGRNAGLLEAINSGANVTQMAAGGSSNVSFSFDIDARGSQMSRAEFEAIATDVVNSGFEQFARSRRAA